jgi:hypothetical protein
MEWLQSVEAHPDNDIAEAASSKFLTATTLPSPYHTSNINVNNTLRRQHHHHHPPSNTIVVPLQRQMSSPPITNIPTTTSPFTKVLPTTATTKRPPH